jgi:hypothetical protein
MITLHISAVLYDGTVRRVHNLGKTGRKQPPQFIDISEKELAPEITERMALLRLAPPYDAIIHVGKRLFNDEYHLYFPDDFDLTRLRPTDASPRGDA